MNGINTQDDLILMMNEITVVKNDINKIVNDTQHNGQKLLDGTYSRTVIIGTDGENINVSIPNLSTDYLGKDNTALYLDNSTVENCEKSLESVEQAIIKIGKERAKLGAIQKRMECAINYHEETKSVLNSKIENTDTKNLRLALAGLNVVQECLGRTRKLIIQGQTETWQQIEREHINYTIQQMKDEIDRIVNHTKSKDGVNLLNGEYDTTINVTLANLGLNLISNATLEESNIALEKLDNAIITVFKLRKEVAQREGTYIPNELNGAEKWAGKIQIINNELVYVGTDSRERKWASDLGIKVK